MKTWLWGGVVAAGLVGLSWLIFLRSPAAHRDAQQIREVATRRLAEYLGAGGTVKRVLLVGNPFAVAGKLDREMAEMERAGERGFMAAAGTKFPVITAAPELKPGVLEDPRSVFIDPETTTPLSFLVTEGAFDQLANQHPDCDVIVSLIGLPANLARTRCWQSAEGPKFALLLPDLRMIGSRAAVERSFGTGKLLAFVAAKPGAVRVAGGGVVDFDQQFLLVTRENFAAVLKNFPQSIPER
jgi:hypothetical protein